MVQDINRDIAIHCQRQNAVLPHLPLAQQGEASAKQRNEQSAHALFSAMLTNLRNGLPETDAIFGVTFPASQNG